MANGTPRTQAVSSKPAPIGGINARDSISVMPEQDAISLVNWIPDTYGVRVRKGFAEWATNFPTDEIVTSILSWIGPTSTFPAGAFLTEPTEMPGKMFAVTDQAVYDVTSSTDAPVSVFALGGNELDGWLSSAMLSNIAGSFLCVAQETGGYFYYDGTTWTRPIAGAGAGEIDGVDPLDLVFVMSWKRRLWFVEKDTTRAWYLPTDSITGVATEFDFGAIFSGGGHLSYLAKWTIDAGEGIDDFLVAVSSLGDVAIYKGTDPASVSTFSLVGKWNVGQIPVGRRAFVQYGGDLVLLSADGVCPVSFITRGGSSLLQATGNEYSSMIRLPLGRDIRASFTEWGWQMILHPSERLMVVSVPDYNAQRNKQYAMNTALNRWCVFDGIPIQCMASSAGYTFAGTTDGRVIILFNGFFDEQPLGSTTGNGIRGVVQPAFSYFNTPAQQKHFHMVRPSFLSNAAPNYLVDVNVNFAVNQPVGSAATTSVTTSAWDAALWDDAVWGGQLASYADWVSVNGLGFSGAVALVTETTADTVLTSIDYMLSSGGPL